MSNNKTCTRCGEEKPATLEYFHKSREALIAACKVCRKAYQEANKEAIAEYGKAYYKANREAISEKNKAYREANRENRKAYYKANKEAIAERNRAWYEANKEYALEQRKAYREANREAIAEQSYAHYRTPKGKFTKIKMKAKERGINFSLLFELYETQLWGKPCHYCGCEIEVTGLDRKDSSKGYSRDNVVPCCWDCNRKKQDKPYDQFIQEQKEAEDNNK